MSCVERQAPNTNWREAKEESDGMKLLKKKSIELPVEEPKKKSRATVQEEPAETTRASSKIPPDEYRDEMEPRNIDIDEENRYIVVSVKRGGEFGLPNLDIRYYQTTDVYTGFTRKGISIPLEYIGTMIDTLVGIKEESENKDLI